MAPIHILPDGWKTPPGATFRLIGRCRVPGCGKEVAWHHTGMRHQSFNPDGTLHALICPDSAQHVK